MSTAFLELADADATLAAGARLAPEIKPGMIVTLSGDLGAGKTTLVRGCLPQDGLDGHGQEPDIHAG